MRAKRSNLLLLLLLFPPLSLAGPPFKTDDPQPVEFRHWEFYVASEQEYKRAETGATCPHIEVNYGLAPGVQVHLVAPLGYARSPEGTHVGYSDTELGVKYRFLDETAGLPQVGVFPLVELPTGNANEDLGAGNAQLYLPAWAQKSWGSFTTYAGGGFWLNPADGRKNWWFAGWEAQYDLSAVVTLGGELFYRSADEADAVSGGGFNLGGYVNLGESHHILFSFGHSLSGVATFTGYLGYQLTV